MKAVLTGYTDLNMKLCTTCKKEKTLENTNVDRSRKDGLNKYCKSCLSLQRNTEEEILKRKVRQRAYYLRNKQTLKKSTRDYSLKKKFNTTEEEYNSMLAKQNYCCAICKTNEKEFSRKLAVDHCHVTGNVRGLLCFTCNTALGKFKDSTKLLNEAIKYLEENTDGDQEV